MEEGPLDEDATYGDQGGLGALDIAALQLLYGPNMSTATGRNVYKLPAQNGPGTGWSCIWDAGGTDTISASRSRTNVTIDLRDETLDESASAAGFISRQAGISGGFTIANGVEIENATGGRGNDRLIGNEGNNLLRGNAGRDALKGGAGDDILQGGQGKDVLVGGDGHDAFVFNDKLSKSSQDKIRDFDVETDTIRLDDRFFKSLKPGSLSEDAFCIGPSARDADDRVIYNLQKGVLSFDADGSGRGHAVKFATVEAGLVLTADHFLII